MLELDSLDRRRRSSGGRFSGCVSKSTLLRREEDVEGSVACLDSRACRGVDADDDKGEEGFSVPLDSRYDVGRGLFFAADLLTLFLDDFVGDGGSDCGCGWCRKKSRSSRLELGVCFLDEEVDDCFLLPPKNFILGGAKGLWALAGGRAGRPGQTWMEQGCPETRLCRILEQRGGGGAAF